MSFALTKMLARTWVLLSACLAVTATLALIAATAAAAGPTLTSTVTTRAVGLWRTMDEETGKPTGLVRVYEQGGKLYARIEQVLASEDAKRLCRKCTDERKNQPITGLVIMRNMTLADDEYIGGDILDPKNGQVYRCRLRVKDGGKKLEMRGFIGFALLGRTQVWERAGN